MIKKQKINSSASRVLVGAEREIVTLIPGAGLGNKGTAFALACKWLNLCADSDDHAKWRSRLQYEVKKTSVLNWYLSANFIACEQVLRGSLAWGREKEGEFATTSELSYLSRSARSEDERECKQTLKIACQG